MIKITKEMIIGDILNEAPDMAPISTGYGSYTDGCRNALHRLPVCSDGNRRRGCLCSWYRAGAAHHQSKCFR